MRYRSKIDIISQILEAANGGNATRSKITYKAFINYDQLKENLTALTKKDLLCYNEDTQTFKTTEKGLRFLDTYNQIGDMIREEERQQTWIQREQA
ncbi:MAG: winged helix-turn-helix domain-containing protein [Thermoproteota archaeon]|nr:winged helix-turn-helix domain-containing protein [Thermoproteota archaeon]